MKMNGLVQIKFDKVVIIAT